MSWSFSIFSEDFLTRGAPRVDEIFNLGEVIVTDWKEGVLIFFL